MSAKIEEIKSIRGRGMANADEVPINGCEF
jgi:hypothetical protein